MPDYFPSILDTRFHYHYDLLKLERFSGNPDSPDPSGATGSVDQAMTQPNANGSPVGPQTAYAVVAGGIITPESDIITLSGSHGMKFPVVVAVFDDKSKAEAYKNRVQAKVRRILHFNRDDVTKSTPIYGVQEVTVQGKRPRKPMSDEEKRRRAELMQAGRNRSKGPRAGK